VHRGDAPAEYQANRLSAQLLDVDLHASKGQQLIHAITPQPYAPRLEQQ
jgi:hypothetical protein